MLRRFFLLMAAGKKYIAGAFTNWGYAGASVQQITETFAQLL